MFTGLIETMGIVRSLHEQGAGYWLVIEEPSLAEHLQLGESVAVNGVCLTVVGAGQADFAFQVGPETLNKTNLGRLKAGEKVNLERPVPVGGRLGGNWVQGHIDGTGVIVSRENTGDWDLVWIECSGELAGQMVAKGSVAVDGVSLTLVEVKSERFSVALIPHTLAVTTLGFKKSGDTVNLETDILGKYVWKYLESMKQPHR